MSQPILPLNEEKIEKIKAELVPVSDRNIRRSEGEFYIEYTWDNDNGQFLISRQEIERIARNNQLDPVTAVAKVRGRITELLVLREIYELLWNYRKHLPSIKYERNRIPDLVRVCTHKGEHPLVDIYIPILDLHIDCKNRWTQENSYKKTVEKLHRGIHTNTAWLQPYDLMVADYIQREEIPIDLFYASVNFSIPNTTNEKGMAVPMTANLLETSIKVNGLIPIGDIEINSKDETLNKKQLPTNKVISFDEFMKKMKQNLENKIKNMKIKKSKHVME